MRRTFASRILAGYLLIFGLASWVFYDALLEEIKPVMRQSTESVLIDTANILAELVTPEQLATRNFDTLTTAVSNLQERRLEALVWEHLRTDFLLNFYVTDADGIVLFSSENKDVGEDYSQWRDVYLTLRGQYGARSTLANEYVPESSVMHVAAPIYDGQSIVGVLTVYNPNITMQPFVDSSRNRVLQKWALVLLASGLVALVLSYWLSHSVARLGRYAQQVEAGEKAELPHLQGSELRDLADAIESMRAKLEGKAYVEHYVQTLTHELKSPMAAIRGATEMLKEKLPDDVRTKFVQNIQEQNQRMQRSVDQLLRLAALENQQAPASYATLSLCEWVTATAKQQRPHFTQKQLTLTVHCEQDATIEGDKNLLVLALHNVLENACAFSSPGGTVNVRVNKHCVSITDEGAGLPDYAINRAGEKFFSLPRPDGSPKSTGLGLALTREICRMHHADLTIANRTDGPTGAVVHFEFSSHNPHKTHA
jgi:two-component system sensor histidine kinase CreC